MLHTSIVTHTWNCASIIFIDLVFWLQNVPNSALVSRFVKNNLSFHVGISFSLGDHHNKRAKLGKFATFAAIWFNTTNSTRDRVKSSVILYAISRIVSSNSSWNVTIDDYKLLEIAKMIFECHCEIVNRTEYTYTHMCTSYATFANGKVFTNAHRPIENEKIEIK